MKSFLKLVIVGHVDHGKSTIIGRLLADTGSLPQGKLEQIRENCRRNAKPFEYAFLLDALKDEQAQGITIDSARCFFKTASRNYIVIDAPGHIEFLKNMVTGAARAEAALLVIDAAEGVQENSKRHGYLLSLLGIRQVAVIINKMDLVNYSEEAYHSICHEYGEYLLKLNIVPQAFIPASGFLGENVTYQLSDNMPWYGGHTILEQLENFIPSSPPIDKPFRMYVQGVYKFTNDGDSRRIIAGGIDTGYLAKRDEIIFFPSGKKTTVASLEVFNAAEPDRFAAEEACSFTMTNQIYITRGELAVKLSETKPHVAIRIKVNLFWLGKKPLQTNQKYQFKIGTMKVGMQVEEVVSVMDSANLIAKDNHKVESNEVAQCILRLDRVIAFDLSHEIDVTSRFVIVDAYEIAGGGIIVEELQDERQEVRNQVIRRNMKWEQSDITTEQRISQYKQNAALIMITGPQSDRKKQIAKVLERKLFDEGRIVYFIGISNVLYGIDADIKVEYSQANRSEQLRRMAEAVYLLLDAGVIVIVTARDLTDDDMGIIKTIVQEEKIYLTVINPCEAHLLVEADLVIKESEHDDYAIKMIMEMMCL